MKKIVYLVTEDWYFCSHRLDLAKAAKAQGYKVYVITRAGALADKIRENGFVLIPIMIPRGIASPIRELNIIIELVKHYKNIKPDLVHHIALKPIMSGSIAARFAKVPRVVNTFAGLGNIFISESNFTKVIRFIFISIMRLVLHTKSVFSIVQNNDDAFILNELGVINKKRTLVIPGSGVDTKKFSLTTESIDSPVVVLFASRLLKDKGIYEFIGAARLLRQKNLQISFVLVGDRDESNPTSISEEELLAWINEGVIEWWGYRDDMEKVLAQVHLLCLPSYREGLPKILLEAASRGRAIVTTDVAGCRDVVKDGVNGLLVPVKNTLDLANAIEKLATTPALRSQMGKSGSERVKKHFNLLNINLKTIDLYNELINL
jgi:glycosyltransferase involved in cell wall biosynthesis